MTLPGGPQMLLLAVFMSTVSGAQKLNITPDTHTTLIISGPRVRGCRVCAGAGPSPPCGSSLLLNVTTSVSLDFNCSRPQDVFKVEIVQSVECTTKSCNGHIIQTDSSFGLLLAFNRTFTWNLKASPQTTLKIDFTKTGLRQIRPWEVCEDGHSYTLQASQATGSVAIGKYCRVGSISSVQIQNNGRFSVEVPARQKLHNDQFNVSVGEEIKSFAKVTLTFPEGSSSSELLSPNYPDSFPNSGVIEWDVQVPDKHRTSVQFLNVTQPRCLKNMTAVEYHSKGRAALVQSLTDPQHHQEMGNVSLTLRNCEVDMRRSTAGLSVGLRVSITPSQVRCTVNMSEAQDLTLHIEKVKPTSACQMELNSEMKDKITVSSNGDLSFQDCSPDDVQVTATRLIECRQLSDCPKAPFPLLVPTLPPCLPAPLISVTWTFRPPQHATVELASPYGPLKQALPGQPCNDSLLIKLTEGSKSPIGDFCSQGAIEKLQIHTNMSVTVSNVQKQAVKVCYKHALNVCFKEEIPERYIFTVTTKADALVVLATPGWPAGMEGYSTVSWIVSVPPGMEARLLFANLTQPKCRNYHTDVSVQRVGHAVPEYSRREDEPAQRELTVSGSFYLNMSNCQIERGRFSVLTKVTLQAPSRTALLTIILSAVAAVLVLVVVAVVVACEVKKKRKNRSHQTAVYNPNGAALLPGRRGFPKRRADNGSHEYATIDEMRIYSHLLSDEKAPISDEADSDDAPVGVYHPFQAPPLPDRPPSRDLVDNDLYQTEGD